MKKTLLLLTFFLFALSCFSQADLKVINSDYKDYYIPGSTNTYTITIVNLGPAPAANVNVYNGIPSGVINFNWTGPNGISGINNPVNDKITTLAPGAIATYVVNMTIPISFSGNLKSEVTVTSDTPDPNPTCDQCIDIDTKGTGADLVVTNSDNKLYYVPGTSSVYTVKVTNKGPLNANSVKVTNMIPAGITQFSWTGSNGSMGTNVALNNTIASLKVNETVTYTITMQVPAGFTGNLTSQANAGSDTPDPNPGCADCIDTDTMLSGADIVVTNTDGKTSYTAGGTNTYTVKVENKGPQDAANVVVTNTLPAGISAANVSWTGNSTSGTGFLNNNITNLPVGQSVSYTVTVQVPTSFFGNLAHSASATAATSDPDPDTNQATDTDTQSNATDIVVVNTDNSDVYTPGTSTVYKVTVTNAGTVAASNVAVTNLVPAGIPPANMTWTGSNGSSGTGNLNNTITTLNVKQTVTYTVTVLVPSTYTGNLVSTVSFTSSTIDSDPSCNLCTDTDKQKSGVVVTKTDNKSSYIAGQSNTYTITVTNHDAAAISDVAIQDLVPAGINPADVTWSGNGASGTGNLNNTIATLAPNQTVTYTVIVKIPSSFDQKTNLVNEVTYSVGGVPNTTVCTQCKDVDTPNPYADLQVLKTDNQSQFLLNSTNTYTIVIANNGPSDAVNITVEDKMPPGITSMSWSGSNGTSGTGNLNDVIPTLAVGQVMTYTVNLTIPATYSPQDPVTGAILTNLTNSVKVTSNTPDPVPNCPGCSDVDAPRPDYVTVDTNKYTVTQLVTDVLINSPCVKISNFSSSATCGFGYFHRNNSDFPIKDGVVIRSGMAAMTQGKYDDLPGSISSVCSGAGDDDLYAINSANGNKSSIRDASFVKFNFVSGGDKFKFNYLFASQEYGQYQCGYSDAFAFILKDVTPGATTPAQNLAVIPNTQTQNPPDGLPVSVTNIRKNNFNASCPDSYPEYFGKYNKATSPGGGTGNPAESEINMRGQTVLLTATADVIPGHEYSIKLVIGDYIDTAFDSAVFIEAGSFDIGFPKIYTPAGVIEDVTLCPGSEEVLQSGTSKLPHITYSWKKDGVTIPGANDYKIAVKEPGVYTVLYTYNTGCEQSDDINVILPNIPPLQEPNDLVLCEDSASTFDLSTNVPVVLGANNPNDYIINYYHSQADADIQLNPIMNYKTYPGQEGEAIFMTLEYLGAGANCVPTKNFKLNFSPAATGTIEYVEDGGVPGFCRDSNAALAVTKSTPFTEGGTYSVSPSTGLTIDAATGTLDLTNAIPGDYVVTYNVPATAYCPEYNTTTNVKINACITVDMDPITAICPGDTVTLTCNDAGAGVEYTWSDINGVLGTTTVPTFTLAASPTVSGNHTFTVVGSYGTEQSAPSSEVLVVNVIPVASISEDKSICSGTSTTLTISGTPGAFVTYNDGTGETTVQLSTIGSTGTYVLNTGNLTASTTYELISVAGNTTPDCKQLISSSSAEVSVIEPPLASVVNGSASSICMGESTDVVFNGTPGAEVLYTVNGLPAKVILDAAGNQTVVDTGVLNIDTEYKIVSVTSSAAACVGYPVSSAIVDVVVIPEPELIQDGYICIDPVTGETTRTLEIQTGLNPANYTFEWFLTEPGQAEVLLSGTDSFYIADKVGQYKVIITDNGPLQCKRTALANVLKSVPPVSVVAEVTTGYFHDNATVVVTASPQGDYEYRLDYGAYQNSNVFHNVSYGEHTVYARDKEACGEESATLTVVNFPRYFTPNGDGYNDEWNISVLNDQPNAKIYIFDRFGKLLKQISPAGTGWDGTYNGSPMPADDYWFIVQYEEQSTNKEFKAHISLKR